MNKICLVPIHINFKFLNLETTFLLANLLAVLQRSNVIHSYCVSTHLSRIDFPTIINWTSPFLFKGCWVVFLFFIQKFIEYSVSKQWRP